MCHGGPHLLPLQQQGIEDNTDTLVTFIIYRPEFAVPPKKRDRGRARGGKQEEK